MRETDLYPAVKSYLENNGYEVQAEVKGIDVVARRGDDLIAVELKTSLNLKLLIQATRRQSATPSVYVAVPEPARKGSEFRGALHVLKRLQLGLLLVRFGMTGPSVRRVMDPAERTPAPRQVRRQRLAIIEEVEQRRADYNTGGSTRAPILTAYRETAVVIAACLSLLGESSPRTLKAMGTGDKTRAILYKNHYGWFKRVDRGVYAVTATGEAAMKEYPDLAEYGARLVEASRREDN